MDEKEPKDVQEDVKEEEEKEKERSQLLVLAEWRYRLRLPDSSVPAAQKAELKAKLLDEIKKNNMAPFYKSICSSFGWPLDADLHAKMTAANDEEVKKIDAKIEDAKTQAGDMEVRDGLFNRAEYFARIGDKERAIAAYATTLEKSVGAGSRIDLVFATIRLAMFHQDTALVKKYIDQAHGFVESGGDWERRNLLKIYEAAYCLLVRDFKKAATLFIDSIATFTCYELFDYNTFIFYAVLCALLTVDRVTLQSKVMRSPEVLGCIREIPNLQTLLHSFYKSKYADFFVSLAGISEQIKTDMFLGPHYNYFIREIRIVAYKQYLQSYSSVKLSSMSETFGVSVDFLDTELAKFIAGGRLNCKLDKVHGIVETSRPDAKNQQYREALSQGDALLNRIQKLTKVIAD